MKKTLVTKEAPEELSLPPLELREASFIMPMVEGDEAENQRRNIVAQIAMRFGGCTFFPVIGAWKTDLPEIPEGMLGVQIEPNIAVVVAIPEADEGDLRSFALSIGRLYKQEAVYFKDWHGRVTNVTVAYGPMN